MRCTSERAMLLRIVGLLLLSSLCSAMVLQDDEDEGSTGEPSIPPFHFNRMFNDTSSLYDPKLETADADLCDLLWKPMSSHIPFHCICSHCKAIVGAKGDRGDRGLPGRTGSPGVAGMRGFKGKPGFEGLQGIKGQKGDIGEKGQSGKSGLSGPKGSRGFKGEKGDSGLMGFPGKMGPQGETGSCPAACDSAPGLPGPRGPPGPAGARGLPGVVGGLGPKGFKGDTGDMGDPGNPGPNGPKGDKGAQGLCECSDGENGQDGSQGPKGDKGEEGDTGPQGDPGPTGPKGDKGDIGMRGPIGICALVMRFAFSASTTNQFPSPGRPLPFETVHIKLDTFLNSFGAFSAPVTGTYVFTFHPADTLRSLMFCFFRGFQCAVENTETVIFSLERGMWVWVQVKEENTVYTNGESTSTFSGYLLYSNEFYHPISRDFTPLQFPEGPIEYISPNTNTTSHV